MKKGLVIITSCFLFTFLFAKNNNTKKTVKINHMSISEIIKYEPDSVVFIDCRSKEEYNEGNIIDYAKKYYAGLEKFKLIINIPYDDNENNVKKALEQILSKKSVKFLVLYCCSGHRARIFYNILKHKFQNLIKNLRLIVLDENIGDF